MREQRFYKKCTNDELVDLYINKNDKKAFDELFSRYEKDMFNSILHIVSYNTDLAEDLLQETRLKIIEKVKTHYEEKKQFRSWAIMIAKNTARDYLRKEKKELALSELTKDQSEAYTLDEWLSTNKTFDLYDKKDIPEHAKLLLRELINELPEKQKNVLIARIFHNLSFKDIAKNEKIKETTAISRMHYALNKLRRKIETDPRGKQILELVPRYGLFIVRRNVKPKLT